jgi:hypothetical protein
MLKWVYISIGIQDEQEIFIRRGRDGIGWRD